MKRLKLTAALAALFAVVASPAFAFQIFVSNEKDNTVTVVDGDTLEVVKTIPTARRPRGIITSPDGKEVFVACGDGDIIDVIDVAKLEVVRQLESGPDPELMAVDPKGDTLYVANEDDSMATVMNTKTGEVLAEVPVGVEPEGVGISPDSKYTVVTSESTSMAHVIDNATLKLIENVLVDTRPREAKFTPDGSEAWVSSEVGGTIAVIDTKDWNIKKKIGFGVQDLRPELLQLVGMEFTKDGKHLRGAGAGEPGGRHRPEDQGGHRLYSRRPAPLASGAVARPDEALRGQRAHQRHDYHRCGEPQGGEVSARGPAALGRGDCALTRTPQKKGGAGKSAPFPKSLAVQKEPAYCMPFTVAASALTMPLPQAAWNSSASTCALASLSTML